jgi:hypothetical protein
MATSIRRPAAPPARAPAARASSRATPTAGGGYRGAEGLRKMREEEERNAARREAARSGSLMPFRFFCPAGETREVIIVDDQPDFFRYEHNLKDRRTGKWNVFTACINEDANCPVCEVSDRPSYFALYLTVIDLTPYDSEKHGYVEWSKKLLVVKSMQQKKVMRLLERHGTLRGMRVSLTRDSDKDASIGNDIEFIEFVPEEELDAYVSEFEVDRDGKKEIVEVVGSEVYDYEQLFPPQSEQSLRAIAGGSRSTHDEHDADRGPARTPARTRPAGRAVARPTERGRDTADYEDQAADDATGDEPPRRGTPPSRAALRRPPERAAPSRHGREEPADADDAGVDPPQRGSSLADRRRSLRRP